MAARKGPRDAPLGVNLEDVGRRVRDRVDLVVRAEDAAVPLARVGADAAKEHEGARVGVDLEHDVRVVRDGVDEAVAAEDAGDPRALDGGGDDAKGRRVRGRSISRTVSAARMPMILPELGMRTPPIHFSSPQWTEPAHWPSETLLPSWPKVETVRVTGSISSTCGRAGHASEGFARCCVVRVLGPCGGRARVQRWRWSEYNKSCRRAGRARRRASRRAGGGPTARTRRRKMAR